MHALYGGISRGTHLKHPYGGRARCTRPCGGTPWCTYTPGGPPPVCGANDLPPSTQAAPTGRRGRKNRRPRNHHVSLRANGWSATTSLAVILDGTSRSTARMYSHDPPDSREPRPPSPHSMQARPIWRSRRTPHESSCEGVGRKE